MADFTEIISYFKDSLGQFADRRARWLLANPANLRGLLEIIGEDLQVQNVNTSFIADNLREQESDIGGLYDIAGNVWEWFLDEYNPDFYSISPSHNPLAGGTMAAILSGWRDVRTVLVLRGGSWVSSAKFVRVSNRTRFTPRVTNKARGFRCVMSVSS